MSWFTYEHPNIAKETTIIVILKVNQYKIAITRIYDKRDDFSFLVVNVLIFLGEWGANIPLAQSYGLNISQLVPFARISIDASDFNYRNLVIVELFLHQRHHFIDNFHNILSTLYIYRSWIQI
jgi:hypothetical protein